MIAAATDPPGTWNFKKFPQSAVTHQLVLTGWGPHMRSIPSNEWNERSAGGLTQANWRQLLLRIPESYQGNPHYQVADGELPLEFVPLADFLETHPSAFFWCAILYCLLMPIS